VPELRIEWDAAKNRENVRKHKVSFEEAATVFYDERALLLADPDHSVEEDRFILLGLSTTLRLLVVCHCYRAKDEVIRIISARKATKPEAAVYAKRWGS
jgi:uncharacterized DUF497 family protein